MFYSESTIQIPNYLQKNCKNKFDLKNNISTYNKIKFFILSHTRHTTLMSSSKIGWKITLFVIIINYLI